MKHVWKSVIQVRSGHFSSLWQCFVASSQKSFSFNKFIDMRFSCVIMDYSKIGLQYIKILSPQRIHSMTWFESNLLSTLAWVLRFIYFNRVFDMLFYWLLLLSSLNFISYLKLHYAFVVKFDYRNNYIWISSWQFFFLIRHKKRQWYYKCH